MNSNNANGTAAPLPASSAAAAAAPSSAATTTTVTTPAVTTKRKRAGGPRSKTGCATCRQRRVKCGEERPICHACARGKFTCSGYGDSKVATASPNTYASSTTSNDNRVATTSPPSAMALFPVQTYEIPFAVPGGPADRRALHYFLNHAAPDLAGFIAGGFWESFVPQRCQDEPVVRQALVALSCAHLEYRTAERGVDRKARSVTVSAETTEAYGKALRKLRRYMESEKCPSRSTVLICSTIFYNFELLRGDREIAGHHLDNGLAIVKSWEGEIDRGKPGKEGEQDDFEVLMTKFARMDTIATFEDIKRVPQLKPRPPPPADGQNPDVCRNSQQAHDRLLRDCIQPLINFLVRVEHERHQPGFPQHSLYVEKQAVENAVRDWKLFAETYEWEQFVPLPDRDRARQLDAIGFFTTKAHYYGTQLLLAEALPSSADRFTPNSPQRDRISHHLLKLARTVVELKKQVQQDEPLRKVQFKWSPEPGVVESMLLLANLTRRPEVKAEAVMLVKEIERLEGLSGLVGKVLDWNDEGLISGEVPWVGRQEQTSERVQTLN